MDTIPPDVRISGIKNELFKYYHQTVREDSANIKSLEDALKALDDFEVAKLKSPDKTTKNGMTQRHETVITADSPIAVDFEKESTT